MPLNALERILFEVSLHQPLLFRYPIRWQLYRRNYKDAEDVHEYVLKLLKDPEVLRMLQRKKDFFASPEKLKVRIGQKTMSPFGTAAGMDKNGDALEAFSYVFGFQETGTIVVHERAGNERTRVAADPANEDLYNAQGFPSKGLDYVEKKLKAFRETRGPAPTILASICGLPLSADGALDIALQEMEVLLKTLGLYVDGFVWNPFSPNTEALSMLRTPAVFQKHAELMKKNAEHKLLLAKMGPYEDTKQETKAYLGLVEAFLQGGGHGIVPVNTKSFPKEQIPVKNWGYSSGGRSGKFLKPYMLRAVKDAREAFPAAVIVATGGIGSGRDAFDAVDAGATLLEGYTPYTYHGLGLKSQMERGLLSEMRQRGYRSMEELQYDRRQRKELLRI